MGRGDASEAIRQARAEVGKLPQSRREALEGRFREAQQAAEFHLNYARR